MAQPRKVAWVAGPRATACLLAVPAPHGGNRGRIVLIPLSPDLVSDVCRKVQVMPEEPRLLDACALDSPSSVLGEAINGGGSARGERRSPERGAVVSATCETRRNQFRDNGWLY